MRYYSWGIITTSSSRTVFMMLYVHCSSKASSSALCSSSASTSSLSKDVRETEALTPLFEGWSLTYETCCCSLGHSWTLSAIIWSGLVSFLDWVGSIGGWVMRAEGGKDDVAQNISLTSTIILCWTEALVDGGLGVVPFFWITDAIIWTFFLQTPLVSPLAWADLEKCTRSFGPGIARILSLMSTPDTSSSRRSMFGSSWLRILNQDLERFAQKIIGVTGISSNSKFISSTSVWLFRRCRLTIQPCTQPFLSRSLCFPGCSSTFNDLRHRLWLKFNHRI